MKNKTSIVIRMALEIVIPQFYKTLKDSNSFHINIWEDIFTHF